MNIKITTIHFQNSKEDGEDYTEPLDLVTNDCPVCNKSNALIIMSRKDRYKIGDTISALLRIQCLCCGWKVMRDYKWRTNEST